MSKKTKLFFALAALVLIGILAYFLLLRSAPADRQALLSSMPAEAHSVLYLDLAGLRGAPFFAELLAWAPKPDTDPAYEQFRRDTGFDYEKDLYRVSVAFERQGASQIVYAMAAGRFDHKKIIAYAANSGTATKQNGRDVFSVPVNGAAQHLLFTFLRSDLIALTNGSDLRPLLDKSSTSENADWHTRFSRLAGSPAFLVVRNQGIQEALAAPTAPGSLAQRATGGFTSPQLSSLLQQLQWVTVAGKPENDHLRIVAEGESSDETNIRQLTELLNGVTLLAGAGLNNPKTRQQLPVATRDAYRDLLKSVDVSRVDRGETKSVRLMFDVSPQILKAAQAALPPPSVSTSPAAKQHIP
jgi:hypothetical protein